MKRRHFLATAGVLPLTGCLSSVTGTVLDGVFLSNGTDDGMEVEFEVERNGDVIHSEVLTAPPTGEDDESPYQLRCEWPSSPANYTVRGRIVGTDRWASVSFGEFGDPDSYLVDFRVSPPRHLAGDTMNGETYPTDIEYDCGYRE